MTYFSLHKTQSKKRFLALSLAFVITLGTLGDTTKVLAIPDEQFYSSNDILFYDPDASCGVATSDGLASLVGSVIPEQIWNFLVAKGLTNEQAAGVLGNIRAESGANFDPAAEEIGGGGGYGIVQWTDPDGKPGRRTALFAAAAKKGVPPSDLAFQLEYLYQELTVRPTNRSEYKQFSNEWEMMQGQGTIEDALVAFHHEFEISHLMNKADPRAAVIQERLQYAKDAFASFSKNTPAAGSNTSECEAAPTGNLAQTIMAYAWPDYKGKGSTEKKPEYEAAVKKAKSQGRYTGDPCFGGGVDCGAFITILMVDSGFEPGYNSNGKGGNTSDQMDWAQKNWQTVGRGGEVRVGGDPSDSKVLRQGDVALKDGHTYMYAGDIPGFNSKIASSSQCDRAPMAGKESPTDNDFTWFRKK